MKVVIEDGFSKIKKTGIGQYTLMIENLVEVLGYNIVMIDKHFLCSLKNKILRRILYIIWLNSLFLLKLLLINDDIIVICTNYAIPVFKLKRVKFIPVIHDLCSFKFPKLSSKIINNYEKANVKNAIKNSEKIITVSNTVRNEISQIFNYNKEKIFVINSSLTTGLINKEDIDFSNLVKKYGLQEKKYILSVATNNKRKNLSLLIDTFNNISKVNDEIKLVLVGNNKIVLNNSNVVITGYISDSELKCLYKHALIYIFPSIYEGFGTPLIDAQSFDVPVLCSDIPIFREIGGNSVEYFKLRKNDLYDTIMNIISNDKLIKQKIEEGHENIKRFNSECIKKQLFNVLKNV